MAVAKHAQVHASERLGPDTHYLQLQMAEPLGFVGGQYIIVDSGLTLPNGKAAKRAYSLLSSDAEQQRLELAVKHIPAGLCSGYMHALQPGARVTFSGPWGKLTVPEQAASEAVPTLIIATDTGITAALGLLQSRRMSASLGQSELLWLQADGDDFLPRSFVRERVPAACGALRIEGLPAIGDPRRITDMRALLGAILERSAPARLFLSGDGAVNYALLDDACAAGIPCTRDNLESFFNMPKKSPPPPQAAAGVVEGA